MTYKEYQSIQAGDTVQFKPRYLSNLWNFTGIVSATTKDHGTKTLVFKQVTGAHAGNWDFKLSNYESTILIKKLNLKTKRHQYWQEMENGLNAPLKNYEIRRKPPDKTRGYCRV